MRTPFGMVRISCHELDFLSMKDGVPPPYSPQSTRAGLGGRSLSVIGSMLFVRTASSLTTLEENNEYPAFT
jgi:hypothetical protein